MASPRRLTLAEQAYEELQEQIVSGQLSAGQRLLADQLADAMAVSQTPIKEALTHLARDGLVEGVSRRGSVVRRFTRSDILQIYEARTLLEVHAVTAAIDAGRIGKPLIDGLTRLFEQQMTEGRRQTAAGLATAIELDRAFHKTLVSVAENDLLADWHGVVLRQTQTFRNYSLARYDMIRVEREHGAIIQGLREGNPERVAEALRTHLANSRDEFLSRPPEDMPLRS